MSQVQLARAVGVSERNVVRWETGKNQPRAEHVFAIAEACRCHVADLYEGDADEPTAREMQVQKLRAAGSHFLELLIEEALAS